MRNNEKSGKNNWKIREETQRSDCRNVSRFVQSLERMEPECEHHIKLNSNGITNNTSTKGRYQLIYLKISRKNWTAWRKLE